MKIIINADDCGYSQYVNSRIENAIVNGKITSTTVMANMEDLKGAVRLFSQYRDTTSFGIHINLTEGSPILDSQELLDIGFYMQKGGRVLFNGSDFRRKLLTASQRDAIYKEIVAQTETIMDSGIKISHLDSHHFMHQAVFMIPLIGRYCKQFGVYRMRNYRNYLPGSFNRFLRNSWKLAIKLSCSSLKTTDWFTSFEEFESYNSNHKYLYKESDIVELMVHPGNNIYTKEEDMLLNTDIESKYDCKLINYNSL